MRKRREDSDLDALEDHVISMLDLAVAAWVRHQGVTNVNEVILVEVPKVGSYEGRA
jgi:hypothetical protein